MTRLKVEIKIAHPWWHKMFESWYRTRQYRDGYLRSLTPDIDEHYYECIWPKCKFQKVATDVFDTASEPEGK